MTQVFVDLYTKLMELGKVMKVKDNDYLFLSLDMNKIYCVDSISIKYIDISNIKEFDMIKIFDYQSFNNTIYLYSIIKDINKEKFPEIYDNIFVNKIGVIGHVDNVTVYKSAMDIEKYKLSINTMENIINTSSISISINDIQEDSKFKLITELKSVDGADRYIIDKNHIITLFNGLLPILKSDKIDIQIIDFPTHYSIIFIIRKKKYNVYMFMNCLYI